MVSNFTLLPNYKAILWYKLVYLGRKPQNAWNFTTSDSGKRFYRNFAFVFQRHSFLWNVFIVGIMFVSIHICRDPLLMIYRANNKHRTY
jgi:hypothetical protein